MTSLMGDPSACSCKGWRGLFKVGPYVFCDACKKEVRNG